MVWNVSSLIRLPPPDATATVGPCPHCDAHSGVEVFMSVHSKTPYITPSMDFSFGDGVVWGGRGPL